MECLSVPYPLGDDDDGVHGSEGAEYVDENSDSDGGGGGGDAFDLSRH